MAEETPLINTGPRALSGGPSLTIPQGEPGLDLSAKNIVPSLDLSEIDSILKRGITGPGNESTAFTEKDYQNVGESILNSKSIDSDILKPSTFVMNTSRYGGMTLDSTDVNNLREVEYSAAEAQHWTKSMFNDLQLGVVNAASTAATTFTSIFDILDSGSLLATPDSITSQIGEWRNELAEGLSNFRSRKQDESPLLSMFTTTNGWGELYSSTMFGIGAGIGIAAQSAIITALTGGTGTVPALANSIRSAVHQGMRSKSLTDLVRSSLNVTRALDSANKFNLATSAARTGITTYLTAYGEAAFEGLESSEHLKGQYTSQFYSQNGRMPNEEEMSRINEIANDAFKTRFSMNAAMLMMSNLAYVKALTKNLNAVKNGVEEAAKNGIRFGINNNSIVSTATDLFKVNPNLRSILPRFVTDTKPGKAIAEVFQAAPIAWSEGFEELYQFWVGLATDNYYGTLVNKVNNENVINNYIDTSSGFFSQMIKDAPSMFSTEGVKSFISGIAAGTGQEGFSYLRNRFEFKRDSNGKITLHDRDKAKKDLYKAGVGNTIKDLESLVSDALNISSISIKRPSEAIENLARLTHINNLQNTVDNEISLDLLKYHALFANNVEAIANGQVSIVKDLIQNELSEMSLDEFNDFLKTKGIDSVTEDQRSVMIDDILSNLNKVETHVGRTMQALINPFSISDPEKYFNYEELRKLAAYHSFMSDVTKDMTTRYQASSSALANNPLLIEALSPFQSQKPALQNQIAVYDAQVEQYAKQVEALKNATVFDQAAYDKLIDEKTELERKQASLVKLLEQNRSSFVDTEEAVKAVADVLGYNVTDKDLIDAVNITRLTQINKKHIGIVGALLNATKDSYAKQLEEYLEDAEEFFMKSQQIMLLKEYNTAAAAVAAAMNGTTTPSGTTNPPAGSQPPAPAPAPQGSPTPPPPNTGGGGTSILSAASTAPTPPPPTSKTNLTPTATAEATAAVMFNGVKPDTAVSEASKLDINSEGKNSKGFYVFGMAFVEKNFKAASKGSIISIIHPANPGVTMEVFLIDKKSVGDSRILTFKTSRDTTITYDLQYSVNPGIPTEVSMSHAPVFKSGITEYKSIDGTEKKTKSQYNTVQRWVDDLTIPLDRFPVKYRKHIEEYRKILQDTNINKNILINKIRMLQLLEPISVLDADIIDLDNVDKNQFEGLKREEKAPEIKAEESAPTETVDEDVEGTSGKGTSDPTITPKINQIGSTGFSITSEGNILDPESNVIANTTEADFRDKIYKRLEELRNLELASATTDDQKMDINQDFDEQKRLIAAYFSDGTAGEVPPPEVPGFDFIRNEGKKRFSYSTLAAKLIRGIFFFNRQHQGQGSTRFMSFTPEVNEQWRRSINDFRQRGIQSLSLERLDKRTPTGDNKGTLISWANENDHLLYYDQEDTIKGDIKGYGLVHRDTNAIMFQLKNPRAFKFDKRIVEYIRERLLERHPELAADINEALAYKTEIEKVAEILSIVDVAKLLNDNRFDADLLDDIRKRVIRKVFGVKQLKFDGDIMNDSDVIADVDYNQYLNQILEYDSALRQLETESEITIETIQKYFDLDFVAYDRIYTKPQTEEEIAAGVQPEFNDPVTLDQNPYPFIQLTNDSGVTRLYRNLLFYNGQWYAQGQDGGEFFLISTSSLPSSFLSQFSFDLTKNFIVGERRTYNGVSNYELIYINKPPVDGKDFFTDIKEKAEELRALNTKKDKPRKPYIKIQGTKYKGDKTNMQLNADGSFTAVTEETPSADNTIYTLIQNPNNPAEGQVILNSDIVAQPDISYVLNPDTMMSTIAEEKTPSDYTEDSPFIFITKPLDVVQDANGNWVAVEGSKLEFTKGLPEQYSRTKAKERSFIENIAELSKYLDSKYFVNIEGYDKGKPSFKFKEISEDAESITFEVTYGVTDTKSPGKEVYEVTISSKDSKIEVYKKTDSGLIEVKDWNISSRANPDGTVSFQPNHFTFLGYTRDVYSSTLMPKKGLPMVNDQGAVEAPNSQTEGEQKRAESLETTNKPDEGLIDVEEAPVEDLIYSKLKEINGDSYDLSITKLAEFNDSLEDNDPNKIPMEAIVGITATTKKSSVLNRFEKVVQNLSLDEILEKGILIKHSRKTKPKASKKDIEEDTNDSLNICEL